MLDWGVPDELDADNDLERYVDWYLPRALAAARRVSGHDEVTLAGYCLGGVLAALYAAGHEDARVRNLILMATPRRLQRDGSDGRAAARGQAQSGRDDRRDRQRSRRRALQRLLHARPDDGGGAEGDVAREPVERRVRRGLSGDGDVVARPRAVPGSRLSPAGGAARPPEHPDDRLDAARRSAGRPGRRSGQRAQRDGRARQRRPPGGRGARDGSSSGTPRAARSCGCRAVTSPLEPAGRRSSTRCRS